MNAKEMNMKKIMTWLAAVMAATVGFSAWAGDVAKIVETGNKYQTLTVAVEKAANGETVELLTNVSERIEFNATKTNFINLAGYTWSKGESVKESLIVKKQGAQLVVTNGMVNGQVRANKGQIVLDRVTAKKFFVLDAPGGKIDVWGRDYVLAGTNDVTGLTVYFGTYGLDLDAAGCFDSQDGEYAFVRTAAQVWEVMPTNAVVAKVGDQNYADIYLALDQAANDATVRVVKAIADTVLLKDEVILKKLVFEGANLLEGDPQLKAVRHDEFYTIIPSGNGIQLVHKQMDTHRLTFVVEGMGRIYVKGQTDSDWHDARHTDVGAGPNRDYTELLPGPAQLKPVAEANTGAKFYAWYATSDNGQTWDIVRDADGNRIGYEDGLYMLPYGSFDMPNEDVMLKAVFLGPNDFKARDVTVTVKPGADKLVAVTLDGKDWTALAAETNGFASVKFGTHTLAAETNGTWKVIGWTTNGVFIAGEKLEVMVNDDLAGVQAYLQPNDFAVGADNVVKTYDGQGTNIVVKVTEAGLMPADYTVEYSTDAGANWSTVNPVFTNADFYAVDWRVRFGNPAITFAANTASVTIDRKDIADAEIEITLDEKYIVATGVQLKPGVTIVYHTAYGDIELVEDEDFVLGYGANKVIGVGKVFVSASDLNYTGNVTVDFAILGRYSKDRITYYLDKANLDGAGMRAAVADVAADIVLTPDGVLAVPATVTFSPNTYTVVDIVPGAFTNVADRLVELNLSACDKLNIWGNAIWGLEKLERIDFPGSTWTDSPYYYSKLGEQYNGAGVLVKSADTTTPYTFETNLTLLGVADACDVFEVSNAVTKIAQTAFAGNKVLKTIVLHNGIEEIEQGFTGYLDMQHVSFEINEEPNNTLTNIFLKEGGIEWTKKAGTDSTWTTFAWQNAEAKIVTPAGEETYYISFVDAVTKARDGETVVVLKDLVGSVYTVYITDKRVIVEAEGKTLAGFPINLCGTATLGIASGTYGVDYAANLIVTPAYSDPVMQKWYDTTAGAWRWTVINRSDVVAKVDGQAYRTIQDAIRGATADQTVELVAADRYENITIDKNLTFDFTGKSWAGTNIVADGVVRVKGTQIDGQAFGMADNANAKQLRFNYNPLQKSALGDYHIANGGGYWYLSAASTVAQKTGDAEELFDVDHMDVATKAFDRAGDAITNITVTANNVEYITAARDFTIQTAPDVVYGGFITKNGKSVMTVEGSVFGQNLIDEIDWQHSGAGDLTLAYNYGRTDGTYTVVKKTSIVARFIATDGKKVEFTTPETAIAAIDTLKPFKDFEIGVNNSGLIYDFNGKTKKDGADATFENLVSVAVTATNTIRNVILRGKAAVTGDVGTVVFDRGVRMTNENTAFKRGDVKLIVRKGAYINDPQIYLEPGYVATRRAKAGDPLDGYYVVNPNAECAVTVTVGDHHIHYKTLQDAFALADSGSTIQLYNNGTATATVPAGKSFVLTSDPNGQAKAGANRILGGTITVAGSLTVSNLVFDSATIVGNASASVTIGDNVVMQNAEDGAITMAAGSTLYVDTTEAEIFENVDTNGKPKNVVLADASILVLKKSGFMGTIGLTLPESLAVAGAAFGSASDVTYPDGDLSCAEIRFTNDRDGEMTTGLGANLKAALGDGYTRYVNGFADVETEGKKLLLREGSELVWLSVPMLPTNDRMRFVGRTAYTLTVELKKDDLSGRDYAIVTDPSVTNWVSIASDSLEKTLTFTNLTKNTGYTFLTRRSISTNNTVSAIVNLGTAWTAKYDAKEIAQMFYLEGVDWIAKATDLTERAGNADFVVVTTAGNNGNGYVIKLQKKDLGRGAKLRDDMGKIVLKMHGHYLNAQASSGEAGIVFQSAASYNENLPTDLTVENDVAVVDSVGRIVGAMGADGDFADANGRDGQAGITNASVHLVTVALKGRIEVYGGNGGNGASRTDGPAGNGGKGGDAVVGVIDLTVDGAVLKAGKGGNGGDSTNGAGGNGGNGGAGTGLNVTGTVISGGVYGGNGGNAGGGVTAGQGGAGGNGFSDINKVIAQGGDFTGEIAVVFGQGGKSNDPSKDGEDGKGGKPEAPAAPTVKSVTGDSVTLNVLPGCEYLVFTGTAPTVGQQVWRPSGAGQTLYVNSLVKGTVYTVWARKPAADGNLVSFYSTMNFTTLGHDAADLKAIFNNQATVAEVNGAYVVTLTGNIMQGVQIPDNLGTIKLAMGGWSIKGADGIKDGTPADGEHAITFIAAGGDPLTQLTITGNGLNAIIGGNGATNSNATGDEYGLRGGEGGFALTTDGFAVVVKVTLVNGILCGGNGGDGSDSTNGAGGNGGNGGDACATDKIDLTLLDGEVYGGNGGNGGNVYAGLAGNGGNGGDAPAGTATVITEGGNGGQGGISRDASGTNGSDGEGGTGDIPGVVDGENVARLDGVGGTRFYKTFSDAVYYAQNGDTLTVIRDAVFGADDYVEVTANNLTVTTAPGALLTWDGKLHVKKGVTGFVLAEGCNGSEASEGSLVVSGEATVRDGVIDTVDVQAGGRFRVELNANSLIKAIFGNASDIILLGGFYAFDPSGYCCDPFAVEPVGDLWRIVQDPRFTAMATLNGKTFGIETLDDVFRQIAKAKAPIEVQLLKNSVATSVLTDQEATDAVIHGNGYKIVDARTDAASESALFNLSGNLVLKDVIFDGQGQEGRFIEFYEPATAALTNCMVTGYACANGSEKVELISASAAGFGAKLYLADTVISGNDVSCAVSTIDRTGNFRYEVHVAGATTVMDNGGNGIVSDGCGQLVVDANLTGGYIDVLYAGGNRNRFALARDTYVKGTENLRCESTKVCGGSLEVENNMTYVKWGIDERQYAAKIGNTLYETIEKALEDVRNGDTILLEQDETITRAVTVRLTQGSDSFVLDLNGKTLTNDADMLKFGMGSVTITNGTLACASRDALYLYGATAVLKDVVVDNGIYVARGTLKIEKNANVAVKGVVAKTNSGAILIASGKYTLNPAAYVVSGLVAAPVSDGEYLWKIVEATRVSGIDGYVVDTTPDADGNVALDFTTSAAFGVLRKESTIEFSGNVADKVTVKVPAGWIQSTVYDPASDKTVVQFQMDEASLKPVLGSDDPGDRPLEIVTDGSAVTQVTLRVKNGVKGFWYKLMASDDLVSFSLATEKQAQGPGNIELTVNTKKDKFFKLEVSDRP